MFTYSVDDVIELIEDGREIVYDELDKLDGGYYKYID